MNWNIIAHGDRIEKNFSQFICSEFDNYKNIWELYIGNNGNEIEAKIAEIPGLSEVENIKRIKFSEFHYTCLESVICMKLIKEKAEKYTVKDITEYIGILNDYISFVAHIGRLRDNLKMIWSLLLNIDMSIRTVNKEPVFLKIRSLSDFYEQRCVIVHGKKIPFSISENNKLSTLKSIKINNSILNQNWLWSDLTGTDLVDINTYYNETFNTIVNITNKEILMEIYNELKTFMIDKSIANPIEKPNTVYETAISGSL